MKKEEMIANLREVGLLSKFGSGDVITAAEADKFLAGCMSNQMFAGENAGRVLLASVFVPPHELTSMEIRDNQFRSKETAHRPRPRKLNLMEVQERTAILVRGLAEVFDGETIAIALKILTAQISESDLALLDTASKIPASARVYEDPRDGQTYKTIRIENLEWMAENLNFETRRLVRPLGLFSMKIKTSWEYCGNESNTKRLGRLYSWEGAKNSCPPGWRVPTKEDWDGLYRNLGGEGRRVYSLVIDGGMTGFNVLLGGQLSRDRTQIQNTNCAWFWSATPDGESDVWCFECFSSPKTASVGREPKGRGYNVRLVRGI